MRLTDIDERERLRQAIPAPSGVEAAGYTAVASVLGAVLGAGLWAYTGDFYTAPLSCAAVGLLTLLLKGVSQHRIVASTYRYEARVVETPQPTPVSVEYWQRTETGHVRRSRQSSVAREHWCALADFVEQHGAAAASRDAVGISGGTYRKMVHELRALNLLPADGYIRDATPDTLGYIRAVAGVSERTPPRPSPSQPVNTAPAAPVTDDDGRRRADGAFRGVSRHSRDNEAHVVAMEPIATDDGLLWAVAYAAAAIVGAGGAWQLCLAVEAAGWLG